MEVSVVQTTSAEIRYFTFYPEDIFSHIIRKDWNEIENSRQPNIFPELPVLIYSRPKKT